MKITSRILPPEEYSRLDGLDAAQFARVMCGLGCVVVVEADGEIVATHCLQAVLHAEGLWVREDFRKRGSVGRQLWRLVRETVRDRFGVKWFVTAAATPDVRKMLERLKSIELPAHFVVPVGEK